jgi:hypothetical protein
MDIVINGLENKKIKFAHIPNQGEVIETDFEADFNVIDIEAPEVDELENYLDQIYKWMDEFLNSIGAFGPENTLLVNRIFLVQGKGAQIGRYLTRHIVEGLNENYEAIEILVLDNANLPKELRKIYEVEEFIKW